MRLDLPLIIPYSRFRPLFLKWESNPYYGKVLKWTPLSLLDFTRGPFSIFWITSTKFECPCLYFFILLCY